jgi:hypothetical protein
MLSGFFLRGNNPTGKKKKCQQKDESSIKNADLSVSVDTERNKKKENALLYILLRKNNCAITSYSF